MMLTLARPNGLLDSTFLFPGSATAARLSSMRFTEWSKANADYGRRLINSGLEGARSGREAFLQGGAFAPFLGHSVRGALKPAVFGVCLGMLGTRSCDHHRSARRAAACGLLGGAIGFGLGIAWQNRRFTASVLSAAFRRMEKVRDEHWLEKNPIDYA